MKVELWDVAQLPISWAKKLDWCYSLQWSMCLDLWSLCWSYLRQWQPMLHKFLLGSFGWLVGLEQKSQQCLLLPPSCQALQTRWTCKGSKLHLPMEHPQKGSFFCWRCLHMNKPLDWKFYCIAIQLLLFHPHVRDNSGAPNRVVSAPYWDRS